MENLVIGQDIKINLKRRKLKRFIRKNKIKLTIIFISTLFLSTYLILICQFINLLKHLKFL